MKILDEVSERKNIVLSLPSSDNEKENIPDFKPPYCRDTDN